MSERYPDDAALLSLSADEATGVAYIPTGRSPYYLEFRRMLYRLLRVAERANDLRVYQDGDLSIGVRAGRCLIGGEPIAFAGAEGVAVAASAVTHVWLDAAGAVQTGTSGLPGDRTAFIPLAQVTAGDSAIESITDLRGEAMLAPASLAMLGLTATAEQINQALEGISADVDALALNFLCGGPSSKADGLHGHTQFYQDLDGQAHLVLINNSSDPAANMALALSLPAVLPFDSILRVNKATGFLQQEYAGTSYDLIGVAHVQFGYEGELTASLTGRLIGAVPIDGVVSGVVLSVGANLQSDQGADGITATVKVNGVSLCATDPTITSAAGAGFRSTAQGDGTAAVVKSDGTQQVSKGDVLMLDLTRTAGGTISTEARDVVVLIIIRASKPE
ncbi:MAG TPA: hypothetical protein VF184_08360 [Phycisphaeraceae bacterium]